MIDATQYHDPAKAPGLVQRALLVVGTQKELALRCGVTRDYLRQLRRGDKRMSYALQLTLERIATGE